MKKGIICLFISVIVLAMAFLLPEKETKPSKYDYIDLSSVTETVIENNTVYIYTESGDYYTFSVKEGE